MSLGKKRLPTTAEYFFLILLVITTVLSAGCGSESNNDIILSAGEVDSLTFISQKLNIDREAAELVLTELDKYGPTDEISYIVKSVDYETGEEYYVVWLKNGSVSLYMDGSRVKYVEKGAYGKTEAETTPSAMSNTTVATSAETTSKDTGKPSVDTEVNSDRYYDDDETEPPEIEVPDDTDDFVTTAPETTETDTTEAETTKEETPALELKSVFYSEEVARGSNGYFSAKGTPGVVYRLDVIYPSGKSSAKGLGELKANSFGNLYWEWKVSAQTTLGTHKIVVSCGESEAVYYFTVTPKTSSASAPKVTTSTTKVPTTEAPTTEAPTTESAPIAGGYVVNLSSKKFHLPDCRYAKSIKEENRGYADSRDKAIKMGCEPCKVCNP